MGLERLQELLQHTAGTFGLVAESSLVMGVPAEEERKFREADCEFLRDTHGLPRDLVTELLGEP